MVGPNYKLFGFGPLLCSKLRSFCSEHLESPEWVHCLLKSCIVWEGRLSAHDVQEFLQITWHRGAEVPMRHP